MSTNIIDLSNLAAIIRELKDTIDKLSPEELETLEVLLDDETMEILNLPPEKREYRDLDAVRAEFENSD
jgi:hypothetical protein